jgi:predicted nucleotidyltransferase
MIGRVASELPLQLFRSELQLRMLGLLLLTPQDTWTAPQLAQALAANPVAIHRELHRALASGLLVREPIGKTYVYRAATDSPLYEPLRLLLDRTVGVEAELRRTLKAVPGIEAAFIHGSFATNTKLRPTSDVDVLVLGSVDPRALRRRIRKIEGRLGREIDVMAYTPEEFAALAADGNSLVRGIIRGPVTPLLGTREALKVA